MIDVLLLIKILIVMPNNLIRCKLIHFSYVCTQEGNNMFLETPECVKLHHIFSKFQRLGGMPPDPLKDNLTLWGSLNLRSLHVYGKLCQLKASPPVVLVVVAELTWM